MTNRCPWPYFLGMAELIDSLSREEVRKIIFREVPHLVRTDPEIRTFLERVIAEVGRERFADRGQTEDRFEKMLAELRAMREESERRWEESERRWRELKEESDRRWEEIVRKWEENERRWQENERRWEENFKELKRLHRLYDVGVGALGARWGLRAESSFREAIKGILEESFPIKVERYLAKDEKGEVFGRPDQIELDLIIKDGEVIAAEIKSSMSKADLYTFDRKVSFYEKHEGRKVKRKIVVSPMVAPEALPVAEDLGIEVYTYPDYIEEL